LKQEEFARFLNEKESVAQKWESGSLSPDIRLARKLEKILGINLVERVEEKKVELKSVESGEMTLADMVKVRKRKF
jgi:putative transcription factor